MKTDDALNDLSKSAEPIEKNPQITRRILRFLSKALFSYLPLAVYIVVNIPYFTQIQQGEQAFFNGVFLALSYVFISQVSSLSIKKDDIGNFIYSVKIFCGIFCIALFATDKFNLNWWWFSLMAIISAVTLFFTNNQSND